MAKNKVAELTDEDIAWIKSVAMSKRARVVRDHILKHGSITTSVLVDKYGYAHAPRARADLQDAGVGVGSRMIVVNGKKMAEYFFTGSTKRNAAGRIVVPKPFADRLKKEADNRCAVCSGVFSSRELQADHRVPFRIGGDKPTFELGDWQPLCARDNRAKSWSCEHCPNWTDQDVEMCESCFWARPERYEHVAGVPERRMSLIFQGESIAVYDALVREAIATGSSVAEEALRRLATGSRSD